MHLGREVNRAEGLELHLGDALHAVCENFATIFEEQFLLSADEHDQDIDDPFVLHQRKANGHPIFHSFKCKVGQSGSDGHCGQEDIREQRFLLEDLLLDLELDSLPDAVALAELLRQTAEQDESVLQVAGRQLHEADHISDEFWPIVEAADDCDQRGGRAELADSGDVQSRRGQLAKQEFLERMNVPLLQVRDLLFEFLVEYLCAEELIDLVGTLGDHFLDDVTRTSVIFQASSW